VGVPVGIAVGNGIASNGIRTVVQARTGSPFLVAGSKRQRRTAVTAASVKCPRARSTTTMSSGTPFSETRTCIATRPRIRALRSSGGYTGLTTTIERGGRSGCLENGGAAGAVAGARVARGAESGARAKVWGRVGADHSISVRDGGTGVLAGVRVEVSAGTGVGGIGVEVLVGTAVGVCARVGDGGTGVRVGVRVAVRVGLGGAGVRVSVEVGVPVGAGVAEGGIGELVGVRVEVGEAVHVGGAGVEVTVWVGVRVFVGAGVAAGRTAVSVGEEIGVSVRVGTEVLVTVRIGISVGVRLMDGATGTAVTIALPALAVGGGSRRPARASRSCGTADSVSAGTSRRKSAWNASRISGSRASSP